MGFAFLHKLAVIFNAAFVVGVLHHGTEIGGVGTEGFVIAKNQFNANGLGAGNKDVFGLRENIFIHKKFHSLAFGCLFQEHVNGLSSGSTFIQQGRVGYLHAGKVNNHGLIV